MYGKGVLLIEGGGLIVGGEEEYLLQEEVRPIATDVIIYVTFGALRLFLVTK